MIICPRCDKATRVGKEVVENSKHRVCKKCGEVLDKKYVKPKKKDTAGDKKETETEDKKTEKKPLQRREVKHTAESVIKKPAATIKPSTKLPRKMGGE
jgi:transcription initiation factor TFIIIB Brf1 subunit/transcription initiation factor TFIIB